MIDDYVTKFVYVALIADQTAKTTFDAKHVFEHFAETCQVKVEHYHADNVFFVDSLFMKDIKQSMQCITFCGVGAHHKVSLKG